MGFTIENFPIIPSHKHRQEVRPHVLFPPKCAAFLQNFQEEKKWKHTNAFVQESCKKESPTRAPTVWAWYKFLRPATFFVHIGASEAEVTVVIGNDDPVWSFLGCSRVRNQIYLKSIHFGYFPLLFDIMLTWWVCRPHKMLSIKTKIGLHKSPPS